jgi:hypothetical protein
MISRITRTLRLPLATMAFVLIIFALTSAPASAHWSAVEQGADYAVTKGDHKSGYVCDVEPDGHTVVANWFDKDGYVVGIEEDGGDANCDEITFDGKAYEVQVCEWSGNTSWCTDYHKV